MQAVEGIGQPRVVKRIRALLERSAERNAGFLPLAVAHERLSQRTPQQRAVADRFNLLTQHFFQLFRIIGFQPRDRHDQTVVVVLFQTIDNNLLRGIMVVAFDKAIRHCHL